MTNRHTTDTSERTPSWGGRPFWIWVAAGLVVGLAGWSTWRAIGDGEVALAALYGLAGGLTLAIALGGRRTEGGEVRAVTTAPVAEPASENDHLETVRALSSAIDAVDPFTRGRSYRVSRYCLALGRALELEPSELRSLEYAALLHDIGRTAILYDVLLQPGYLSDADRKAVESHPEAGYWILSRIPSLNRAAELIRAHHEQPDGNGYPHGLTDKEIPVGSRIILVASAFDSITSDRPYRTGRNAQEALTEVTEHAGTMFDEQVVAALAKLHATGKLFAEFEPEEVRRHCTPDVGCRVVDEFLRAPGPAGVESMAA